MSLTIDDPPTVLACASCPAALVWLWSQRRQAWVSFVAIDPETLRVHPCKPLQDPKTWRDLRRGDPPNEDYLAAKAELKTSSEEQP